MKRLLYVGAGHDRGRPYPQYVGDGWEVTRLDADPSTEPDLEADARELAQRSSLHDSFDAVALRHTLEHFHEHEAESVLDGCLKVLKPGGEVRVSVPNLRFVLAFALSHGPDAIAYMTGLGPIRPLDMLYGHQPSIKAGADLMRHRWGYDARMLREALEDAGFAAVGSTGDDQPGATEIEAWGVKP